jgi:hypothetical protein
MLSPNSPEFDDGFDTGFRSCLDQIALTGLPSGESEVKLAIAAARERLGFDDANAAL